MRPTLHEYAIQELKEEGYMAADTVLFYAKLTNRAPKLGDFVPCFNSGEIIPEDYCVNQDSYDSKCCAEREYQAAQDKVIFAGNWEVIDQDNDWVQIRSKKLKLDVEWSGNECDVTVWDSNWNTCDYLSAKRIEDLPREIEFKTE